MDQSTWHAVENIGLGAVIACVVVWTICTMAKKWFSEVMIPRGRAQTRLLESQATMVETMHNEIPQFREIASDMRNAFIDVAPRVAKIEDGIIRIEDKQQRMHQDITEIKATRENE